MTVNLQSVAFGLLFRSRAIRVGLLGFASLLLVAAPLAAADGVWNADAAANWSDTTRWLGGTIADGQSAIADFSQFNITANRAVTIDTTSRTVGTLLFADSVAEGGPPATFKQYTVAATGGATLTLSTATGTPSVSVADTQTAILNLPILGTQGFTKTGGGVLQVSAANPSLTGPLVANGGTLRANNAGSFNGQAITAANGAQIYHNAASIFASNYNIQGDGVTESDGLTRLGAIRFANNGAIGISGTITLDGDAGISARGVTTTGATISGKITGNHALRLNRSSTTTSAGSGTIILSNAANDWTGTTTLEDGTLKLGASGVIPNGPAAGDVVMLNAATIASSVDAVLDLNGFNETINGLAHSPASDPASLPRLKVTNGGAAAATLAVGDNAATANFGGILQNGVSTLALTKIGAGIQTLSGNNTYTGNTTIQAGTLALSSTTSTNNIGASAKIIVGDSQANSSASLDVTGISTAGGFQIATGKTLAGFGTVKGATTVNAGGFVGPGNSVGTLSFNNNLTLAGTLQIEIDGASSVIDKLAAVGSLDISSLTSTVDFSVITAPTAPAYVFATYGSLTGAAFANVTNKPANYDIDYHYQGNQIALVAVPEPATLALAAIGVISVGMFAKRRKAAKS